MYRSISGLCFVPLTYLSIFTPTTHNFDYCSYIISIEMRQCQSSNLVLFSQSYFAYPRSFVFISILESTCQFLQKGLQDSDWDCIESMDNLGRIDILKTLSSDIKIQYSHPFIQVFYFSNALQYSYIYRSFIYFIISIPKQLLSLNCKWHCLIYDCYQYLENN